MKSIRAEDISASAAIQLLVLAWLFDIADLGNVAVEE